MEVGNFYNCHKLLNQQCESRQGRRVKPDTLKIYDVKRLESILDLGLRHAEQICLLEKVRLGGESILNVSPVRGCDRTFV